jgi:hypothetical protein
VNRDHIGGRLYIFTKPVPPIPFRFLDLRERRDVVVFRCKHQAPLKKVRLGIAATSVGFLPIYAAYHRGFYKDEGIELEIILMSLAAANNAFFKGEVEYSAGLTGLALAAARNYPAKILIFTVAKPLRSFVSRKEIKEPRDVARLIVCHGRDQPGSGARNHDEAVESQRRETCR